MKISQLKKWQIGPTYGNEMHSSIPSHSLSFSSTSHRWPDRQVSEKWWCVHCGFAVPSQGAGQPERATCVTSSSLCLSHTDPIIGIMGNSGPCFRDRWKAETKVSQGFYDHNIIVILLSSFGGGGWTWLTPTCRPERERKKLSCITLPSTSNISLEVLMRVSPDKQLF